MRSKQAKLSIARETLRSLASEDLARAAGGTTMYVNTAQYTCGGQITLVGRSGQGLCIDSAVAYRPA